MSPLAVVHRRTVEDYHSGMRPSCEIRRSRLRQLIDEQIPGSTFRGKPAEFARMVDKDARQVSAWLTGAKSLSDSVAREIEVKCLKRSGWLDNEPAPSLNAPAPHGTASQFGGIDPAILHEAETLVLSDEVKLGRTYHPRERALHLAAAYALLVKEGGRLSREANIRFVDTAHERQGELDDRAEDERGEATGQ